MIWALVTLALIIAWSVVMMVTAKNPQVVPEPEIDVQDDMVVFDFGAVQVIRSYTLEYDGTDWAVFWTGEDIAGDDSPIPADIFYEAAHIDDEAILDYHADSLREADHYRREGDYGYHGVSRDEF